MPARFRCYSVLIVALAEIGPLRPFQNGMTKLKSYEADAVIVGMGLAVDHQAALLEVRKC